MKKYYLSFLFLISLCAVNYGQTTLTPGDIVITGFNSDNPDQFSFVLLTDITDGTQIHFTDNGWLIGKKSSSFSTGEQTLTWTADKSYPCGTEIIVDNGSVTIGTLTGSMLQLAVDGDQILVYQGTSNTPSFIYTINFSSNWLTKGGVNSNTTYLPDGLTDGVNALNAGANRNGNYNCSVTTDPALILDAVTTISNWNFDSNPLSIGGCSYTCSVCIPTHSITSFSPISGPVGTNITILGNGFTTSSTVSFNGVSATIVSQLPTEMVVEVPEGISTGAITVTEGSCDLESSSDFIIINQDTTSCEGNVSASDLLISEITDATAGGNTYVEIYNGTNTSIDLSTYEIVVTNNASSTSRLALNNVMLASKGIFVISIGEGSGDCAAVLGSDGILADQNSTINGINTDVNGSDCIKLIDTSSGTDVIIDVWGDCSDDNWRVTMGADIGNEGFDFRRKETATMPSTTFNITDWEIIDWEDNACTDDDYSDIGNYSQGAPPNINADPNFIATACPGTATLEAIASEGVVGGVGLVYQWYYNAPGDLGWSTVTDDSVYSGSAENMLTIASTLGLNGYQYYCQIREDDANCYQASNAVIIDNNNETTTWNGSTWTNGAPTSTTTVILSGDYNTTTYGNIECCSLTINPGVLLEIEASDFVSIQNNLTINGIIEVYHEGSLVMVNDSGIVTNNGVTNIHKTTTPMVKYDYTYWSSPIVNETTTNALTPEFRPYSIYRFEPANFYDVEYADGSVGSDGLDDNSNDWVAYNGIMNPGVGYAAMTAGNGTHTQSIVFSGEVNNGLITTPVKLSANVMDNEDDWNLIGNPYPSAIDADTFLNQANNQTTIGGTIYLWTHNTAISNTTYGSFGKNFTINDYASYNGSGGVMADSGGIIPTGNIASGQGFFVEAITNGDVEFNNSMRDKSFDNTNFFKTTNKKNKKSTVTRNRVWLNLTNDEGAFNQILIGYFDDATNDVDRNYDGLKLEGENHISFYSKIANKGYTIQGRKPFKNKDEVLLGLNSKITGKFKISIHQLEGSLANTDIILNDLKLHKKHDLKRSDYEFEITNKGTFSDRFELQFKSKGPKEEATTNIVNKQDLQIISNSIKVEITTLNNALITDLKIYDLYGNLLWREKATAKSILLPNSFKRNAILIVNATLENGKIISKKVIHHSK